MTYRAIFVDLGGVLIINKAKEVGEKYHKKFGLTKETSRDIFHFLHTTDRTSEELSKYLQNKGISPKLWQNFTHDLYNSEKRNDELFEQLKEARNRGAKIIITTNNGVGAKKDY